MFVHVKHETAHGSYCFNCIYIESLNLNLGIVSKDIIIAAAVLRLAAVYRKKKNVFIVSGTVA